MCDIEDRQEQQSLGTSAEAAFWQGLLAAIDPRVTSAEYQLDLDFQEDSTSD